MKNELMFAKNELAVKKGDSAPSRHYVKSLAIGQSLNECYILKSLTLRQDGDYNVLLSDRTGDVEGILGKIRFSDSMEALVGCPVQVVGCVTNRGVHPLVKCHNLSLAQKYDMSELVNGLVKEKKEEYMSIIRAIQEYIKNPHYKALVDACLTDEVLDKLGTLPATLSSYGKYPGGALASCAIISDMAIYIGKIYLKLGNGIYARDFQWSLLLTAALLHTYGNIKYITADVPFKKTDVGNSMGLLAILQHSLQEICVSKQLTITDEEFADLINTLHASIYGTSSIKAVNKEGVMLRHIISLYNECDVFDNEVANADFSKDKSAWSSKLKRMIQAEPLCESTKEKQDGR